MKKTVNTFIFALSLAVIALTASTISVLHVLGKPIGGEYWLNFFLSAAATGISLNELRKP